MTPTEGERLSAELVLRLAASAVLAEAPQGITSPGELRKRLQRLPEVRELIHLRELAAPVVIARLRALRSPASERDATFAAALVTVLEVSDVRGALPALLQVAESTPPDHPFLPDLSTQAIKALSRQEEQNLGDVRFSVAARQRALERGRTYAAERARELITTLDGAASLVLGADASGVASLREILASHPTVVELSLLSELVCPELEQQLKVRGGDMSALEFELAAFAYVLESGRCPSARSALRDLLVAMAPVIGELPFAPSMVARALAVTHAMPPELQRIVYSEEECAEVVERATAAERSVGRSQ